MIKFKKIKMLTDEFSYEQFTAAGWTDDELVKAGAAEYEYFPPKLSRSKRFTADQVKYILAQTAAAENGEAVDEMSGINLIMDEMSNFTVSYRAFDNTGDYPPQSDYDKVSFSSTPNAGDHPAEQEIEEWDAYLLYLIDTTEIE